MLLIKTSRIATTCTMVGLIASLVAAQDNQLTPDEAKAGYDLLFNGRDLSGWHGYRTSIIPDAWYVPTNAPLGARLQNRASNKQHLLSDKKYKNFDLKVDVQTPVGGNSGIFVRYEEVSTSSETRRSGPEMQICGPNHYDCKEAKHGFGSCYDLFPVKESLRTTWYNPPGQWNQIRIIAFENDYVHYGNGKKLLEYKIGTQEYMAAYNSSKYVSDGNDGRYYHIHEGSILLQDHSTTGQTFRNIKAKSLDVHPFAREFEDGKWPETLPQGFVFGQTTSADLPSRRLARPTASVVSGGPGVLLVRIEGTHTGFEALGLDGRAVPFHKTADGAYRLDRGLRSAGILIVRAKVDGHAMTQVVTLP